MATTTITIEDTPDGRIAVHSNYQPSRGERCSLAQQATLEIIRRTRKEYGLAQEHIDPMREREAAKVAAASGFEQDPNTLAQMPTCPKCGNNRQVWRNQISGLITCHRAYCDTVIEAVQGGAA